MSSQRKEGMSSVWETLNAVKARRQATETTVKQQSIHESSCEQAHQQFERLINEAVNERLQKQTGKKSLSEATRVLKQFDEYCMQSAEMRDLIQHYQNQPVQSQLESLNGCIKDGFGSLKEASVALKSACQYSKGA